MNNMKTILIILDGVSEEKIESLGNITPLEYANTPTLNKIIDDGYHSKALFYPKKREPDSLSCILTILGVHESMIPRNRAYLEALAADIPVKSDEAVLRCNLISFNDGMLESFNGLGLSSDEMRDAAEKVRMSDELKFYHISDYRNLIVLKKNDSICTLKDIAPHENIGKPEDYVLEPINDIKLLKEFAYNSRFEYNGRNYMFYPWGVSDQSDLPSFYSLYQKSCSCVCSAEIVKGIAKAMNIELVKLKCSTGDVDTDLREKSNAVTEEIKKQDFVIAHINGTDEISHRKDLDGKIKFIEKIDSEFLKYIYENVGDDTSIIIVSDHQTSSKTGKHERGFVDVIMNREIYEEGMILND